MKQFALVESGIYIQDSMHFIVGDQLHYLCSVLNSKLIQWLLALIIGDAAGGNAGNADNIWNLHIPSFHNDCIVTDSDIYSLYGISKEEIKHIERIVNY